MLGSYHHRTKEFSAILRKTLEMLQPLFGTKDKSIRCTLPAESLEGIYRNIFTPKDRVVCVVNGKFGEMAAITLNSIGIKSKSVSSWFVYR